MTRVVHQLEKVSHSPRREVWQDEAVGLWELLHDFEVGQKHQLMASACKPLHSVHLNVQKMTSSLAKKYE